MVVYPSGDAMEEGAAGGNNRSRLPGGLMDLRRQVELTDQLGSAFKLQSMEEFSFLFW